MKRLAGYTAVTLGTAAVMFVLWQFRSIIVLLIISLILSAALRPSVYWLASKGLPQALARLLVFLLIFGGFALFIVLISGRVLNELQLLSNYLVIAYDSLYRSLAIGTGFQNTIAGIIPSADLLPTIISESYGGSVIQALGGVTQSLVALAAGVLIIVALSMYWSADRNHFERLWLSALPATQRIEARSIWQTTEEAMGAYMRSEFVQMLLAGVLLWLGYTAMGVSYPLLAALAGAVAWLIPLVGFFIVAGISLLVGLALGGWMLGVAALVYATLVLLFLEFVVEPRLFQRRRFSGLLIIFTMIILVQAYGLVGFIIAPPIAVALQVLGSHIARVIQRPRAMSLQIEALDDRLSVLSESYKHVDEAQSRKEIDNLLQRLEALVDQVKQEASLTTEV